jgi:uncharacterized protein
LPVKVWRVRAASGRSGPLYRRIIMRDPAKTIYCRIGLLALVLLIFTAMPAAAQYPALEGIERLDTVVDYSHGSPQAALVVFPAVREIYQDPSVIALPESPRTVIVFHGEAVRLLSTDRQGFEGQDRESAEQVTEMLRQFHREGIRMEVCMYAVRVLGVDPATLMPEIEQVGNGFISVAGYQNQGYAVVVVP